MCVIIIDGVTIKACNIQKLLALPFLSHQPAQQYQIFLSGRPKPILSNLKLVTKSARGTILQELSIDNDFYEKNNWITGCSSSGKLHCWPCLLFHDGGAACSTINHNDSSDPTQLQMQINEHREQHSHIKSLLLYIDYNKNIKGRTESSKQVSKSIHPTQRDLPVQPMTIECFTLEDDDPDLNVKLESEKVEKLLEVIGIETNDSHLVQDVVSFKDKKLKSCDTKQNYKQTRSKSGGSHDASTSLSNISKITSFKQNTNAELTIEGHVLSKNKVRKTYVCDKCQKSFKLNSHLKLHSKVHKTNPDSTYTCSACSKTFSRSEELSNHVKTVHQGSNVGVRELVFHWDKLNHACHVCKKTSNSLILIIKHMIQVHNIYKPLTCTKCNIQFDNIPTFKEHTKKNHNGKLYCCKFCTFSLDSINKVHSHFLKMHLKINKYECPICYKRFKTELFLNNHIEGHKSVIDVESAEKNTTKFGIDLNTTGSDRLRVPCEKFEENPSFDDNRKYTCNKQVSPAHVTQTTSNDQSGSVNRCDDSLKIVNVEDIIAGSTQENESTLRLPARKTLNTDVLRIDDNSLDELTVASFGGIAIKMSRDVIKKYVVGDSIINYDINSCIDNDVVTNNDCESEEIRCKTISKEDVFLNTNQNINADLLNKENIIEASRNEEMILHENVNFDNEREEIITGPVQDNIVKENVQNAAKSSSRDLPPEVKPCSVLLDTAVVTEYFEKEQRKKIAEIVHHAALQFPQLNQKCCVLVEKCNVSKYLTKTAKSLSDTTIKIENSTKQQNEVETNHHYLEVSTASCSQNMPCSQLKEDTCPPNMPELEFDDLDVLSNNRKEDSIEVSSQNIESDLPNQITPTVCAEKIKCRDIASMSSDFNVPSKPMISKIHSFQRSESTSVSLIPAKNVPTGLDSMKRKSQGDLFSSSMPSKVFLASAIKEVANKITDIPQVQHTPSNSVPISVSSEIVVQSAPIIHLPSKKQSLHTPIVHTSIDVVTSQNKKGSQQFTSQCAQKNVTKSCNVNIINENVANSCTSNTIQNASNSPTTMNVVQNNANQTSKDLVADAQFKCSLCNLLCANACDFEHHMKLHTEVPDMHSISYCKTCKQIFANFCSYKLHYITVHTKVMYLKNPIISKWNETDSEKYQCLFCFAVFDDKFLFYSHCNPYSDYSYLALHCRICELRFTTVSEYAYHSLVKHNVKKPFNCELCELKFMLYPTFKQHVLSKHNVETVYCKNCNSDVCNRFFLSDHVQECMTNTCSISKPIVGNTCSFCDQLVFDIDYTSHMNMHLDVLKFDIKCKLCLNIFPSLHNFVHHKRNIHGAALLGQYDHYKLVQTDKFTKYIPSKSLITIVSLTNEKETSPSVHKNCIVDYRKINETGVQKNNNEKEGKSLSKQSTVVLLKKHDTDQGIIKIPCLYCGETFSTPAHLENHIENLHNACKICNVVFDTKQQFINHNNQHISGLFQFFSCVCGEEFKTIKDYNHHAAIKHAGQNKASIFKRTIKNIKCISTPNKLQCPYCNKIFIQKHLLVNHLLKIHNVFNCKTCNTYYVKYICYFKDNKFVKRTDLFRKCIKGICIKPDNFNCVDCLFSKINSRSNDVVIVE